MTEYIARVTEYGRGQRQVTLTDEEIVRCMDCRFYKQDQEPLDPGWPMMCEDSGRDMLEPCGYCFWGERR